MLSPLIADFADMLAEKLCKIVQVQVSCMKCTPGCLDGPHFNTPTCVRPVGFGIMKSESHGPVKSTDLRLLISFGPE